VGETSDRSWWPFQIQATEPLSEENKAKVVFLEEATRRGLRAFLDENESGCGAITDEDRECFLVWRGKQRCELFLIENGVIKDRKILFDLMEATAFRQAAAEGLDWLRNYPRTGVMLMCC
jgi:hypothetical protein